jgi:hypothetical protein
VEIFRETICTHPLICEVLKTFDLLNPNSKIVTLDQLSAYLTLHLPNLKHAQMMATRATANMVAATAYATLESESKRLKTELDSLKCKHPPRSNKKKSKKQTATENGNGSTNSRAPEQSSTASLKYCYGHGWQKKKPYFSRV